MALRIASQVGGIVVCLRVVSGLVPREEAHAVLDSPTFGQSYLEINRILQPAVPPQPLPSDDAGWIIRYLPDSVAARARLWMPSHLPTSPGMLLTPVLFGITMVVLSAVRVIDVSPKKAPSQAANQSNAYSLPSIVALTSYRFYTGFLSATWMPYLLAMEGASMVDSKQAVFMGSAKLIYGLSVMLNPLFGLLGDQVATVSRWSGRRLFVLAGVGLGGLGIYGCLVAAHMRSVFWYMAATILWMLGEALADVTTEALVPELLPRSQWEISSALRSLNFLIGGLLGYFALICFRSFHYSWLYYGYLVVMVVCALLTLLFIRSDAISTSSESQPPEKMSMSRMLYQAYCVPASYSGGFSRAAFCVFLFSLGSAPMFFLLLMVRDIIGIMQQQALQTHFGIISSLFFIMAAIASLLGAAAASKAGGVRDRGAADVALEGHHSGEIPETRKAVSQRWNLMVMSTVAFGTVCAVIPLNALPGTVFWRTVTFYISAAFLGLAFGSVYSRFQECTWTLLPPGVDIANAMGYAAMLKLAGVGIGNFASGFILDAYLSANGENYELSGYIVLCIFCATTVFAAAWLADTIRRMRLAKWDEAACAPRAGA